MTPHRHEATNSVRVPLKCQQAPVALLCWSPIASWVCTKRLAWLPHRRCPSRHGTLFNCTSDINAWVNLFCEFSACIGKKIEKSELFSILFNKALEGEKDCDGLLSYNYFSGEDIIGLDEGRPIFLRAPNSKLNLANFMRTHLMSALATLKIGLDILTKEENVKVDMIYGHGGFFKTPNVGQRILSAAIGAPVSVMETAGEGGPYGMALLCAYMLWKDENETLEDYLDNKVFADAKSSTLMADEADIEGFNRFIEKHLAAFEVEKKAAELFRY